METRTRERPRTQDHQSLDRLCPPYLTESVCQGKGQESSLRHCLPAEGSGQIRQPPQLSQVGDIMGPLPSLPGQHQQHQRFFKLSKGDGSERSLQNPRIFLAGLRLNTSQRTRVKRYKGAFFTIMGSSIWPRALNPTSLRILLTE